MPDQSGSTRSRGLTPTTQCRVPIYKDEVCEVTGVRNPRYYGTDAAGTCGVHPLPAPPAGGGGSNLVAYSDVSSMRAADATALVDGQLVWLDGYYAGRDGGEGWHRWDAAATVADDGGSVFAPATPTTGRFKRIPDAKPRAEWFGARGGATPAKTGVPSGTRVDPNDPDAGWTLPTTTGTPAVDDDEAITRCLKVYGECRLMAKTYGLTKAIITPYSTASPNHDPTWHEPAPSMLLTGVSSSDTRLVFLDTTAGVSGVGNYALVRNVGATGSSNRLEVRDIAFHSNNRNYLNGAPGQYKTTAAIASGADEFVVEDCVFVGYGRGNGTTTAQPQEAFVVMADATAARTTYRHQVVYSRLRFLPPATETPQHPTNYYPELTLLGAQDRKNVRISSCMFAGIHRAANSASVHAITASNCTGVRVEGNVAEDSDLTMVYADNGMNRDWVVTGNTMSRCSGTFAFLMAKGGDDQSWGQDRYDGVSIRDNVVDLTDPPSAGGNTESIGVEVRAWSNDVAAGTGRAVEPVKDLDIAGNMFALDAGRAARGILLQGWQRGVTPGGSTTVPLFVRTTVRENVVSVPGKLSGVINSDENHSLATVPHAWAICGTPGNLYGKGQADESPNIDVSTWDNVTGDGGRVVPWSVHSAVDEAANSFPMPTGLDASNIWRGYDVDQRETGWKAVDQGRMWTQGAPMGVTSVGAFADAFYLQGVAADDPVRPGPSRRSTTYMFAMTADTTGPRTDWTVLLPAPQFDGHENVGNLDLCPGQMPIRITLTKPGRWRFAGLVDNALPYAEILSVRVPPSKLVTVWCYPVRLAGKPYWMLDTLGSDRDLSYTVLSDGKVPAWWSGALAGSRLTDTGSATVSAGHFLPTSGGANDLGSTSARWNRLFARTVSAIQVGGDSVEAGQTLVSHGATTLNGTLYVGGTAVVDGTTNFNGAATFGADVRLATKSAPMLTTDAGGKIVAGTPGAAGGATSFLALSDTVTVMGTTGQVVTVLGSGALGFADQSGTTFSGLTDTAALASAEAGKMLVVNAAGDGVEYLPVPTIPASTVTAVKVWNHQSLTAARFVDVAHTVTDPVIVGAIAKVNNVAATATILTTLGYAVGDMIDATALLLAEEGLTTGNWDNALRFVLKGANVRLFWSRPTSGKVDGIMLPDFNAGGTTWSVPVNHGVFAQSFDIYVLLQSVVLP